MYMPLKEKILRRIKIAVTGKVPEDKVHLEIKDVLEMVWPEKKRQFVPVYPNPSGYDLRQFQAGDEYAYFRLMENAGFPGWNVYELDNYLKKVLPEGFFILYENNCGEIAASAMALHNPTKLHPFGASLSCVAVDPTHQGKGLGLVVSAAVTCRILAGGYQEIYLETDDWRLPAIKTYLKLGWQPFLFRENMIDRWKIICEKLNWPFTPGEWEKV
jgi:mycothiol synthase